MQVLTALLRVFLFCFEFVFTFNKGPRIKSCSTSFLLFLVFVTPAVFGGTYTENGFTSTTAPGTAGLTYPYSLSPAYQLRGYSNSASAQAALPGLLAPYCAGWGKLPGSFSTIYWYYATPPYGSNPTYGWGSFGCVDPSTGTESVALVGYSYGECPDGAFSIAFNLSSPTSTVCLFLKQALPKATGKPKSCSANPHTPRPISIATGNKWLPEQDYMSGGTSPLKFVRTYNGLPASNGLFGRQWRSSIERRLLVSLTQSVPNVGVLRPDGHSLSYLLRGSAWVGDADVEDRLIQIKDANGTTTEWQYVVDNDEVERYDANGKLLSISDRRGLTETFTYSDGTVGPNGGYVVDAAGNPYRECVTRWIFNS